MVNRVVLEIFKGTTSIRVDPADQHFLDWVRARFQSLGRYPEGFRLIVELLATGQPVTLRPSAGESVTRRIFTEQDPEAGRLVTAGPEGKLRPTSGQQPGAATGSTIELNPSSAEGQVVLGGTAGNLSIIDLDPAVLVGHELIHALHNARGENVAPPELATILRAMGKSNYLVRDPATGEPGSAEELRTITGQSSFDAPATDISGPINWPVAYNLPAGVTENMLRQERGMPGRASHFGGLRAYRVVVGAGETLEQMLSRYSMADGTSIPPALTAAVRDALLDFNPALRKLAAAPVRGEIAFPHGEYMALRLAFLVHQPDVAEMAKKLRVRGAS